MGSIDRHYFGTRPSHQLEAFTCSAGRPFGECRVVASITNTLALAYARPSHQLEAFTCSAERNLVGASLVALYYQNVLLMTLTVVMYTI